MFYPNCDSRWQHPHYRGHAPATSFDQEYLAAAGKVSTTMQRAMAAAAAAHQWQQQNAKDPCFDSFGMMSTTLFLHRFIFFFCNFSKFFGQTLVKMIRLGIAR